MKMLRKPQVNAVIISGVSVFYAFIFILTSHHAEFERMLNHPSTLSSSFWNIWSIFLKQGNLKYIGFCYIALTLAIVVLSFIRKREYDEYQTSILEKGFIIMSIVMVLLFPVAFILILSDSNYAIETIIFLVVTHWSTVLIAQFVYAVKYSKL